MKNEITIPVPEGHEASFDAATNKVIFTPIETKPKFWMPESDVSYYAVGNFGNIIGYAAHRHQPTTYSVSKHHIIFKNTAVAEDVARYQRVFNAVCRAVKQIDPDFVPDWGDSTQQKWRLYIENNNWETAWSARNRAIFPPVSTEEKCQQVIDLLNAEGIVPVGYLTLRG